MHIRANNSDFTYTLKGSELAATVQERDFKVVADSFMKMCIQYVAAMEKVNSMLAIIRTRISEQNCCKHTALIQIYGEVTLGTLCTVLVTSLYKGYCGV